MDLSFDEVEAPPARRTWLWLGVGCVGVLLLVLFLVAPAAAAVAGLILLSAIPLAVLAGTQRTTAPLAAAGAVALVALGGSAVALAVESYNADRALRTVTAHTRPADPPPSDQPAVAPAPRPHTAPAPPPRPKAAPRAPQREPLAPLVPPVRPAVPAAPVPAAPPPAVTAAPTPAAPVPSPPTQPAAPVTPQIVDVSATVAWGRLSTEARAQLCLAALRQALSVPPGQCR
ncbi:hypothetical protein SA2016_2877 [Sinomonas atrocyanea]|uniref:Uncharacterized protein n=3 Tax=Sinomonas atrocyanea TaxID=37927 RepID=A0A127A791_9MICC|nr:hypothetical protein [Sinomonas atrocyanea]AMM33542.1 hypothetical protein SA2016_2877 [Sinomonas atrocyanea]GEB62983.1 hypothetical protein SAT01_04310 [Sinomonas atrocyanea]